MIQILVTTVARVGDDPGFWRVRLADSMAAAERAIANQMATGLADYPVSVNIEAAGIEDKGILGRYYDTRIEIRTHRIGV